MLNEKFSLQGKNAFITGASSGIGRHFALTLANAGANVVLAARRVDRLEEAKNEINAMGKKAFAVALDVTQQDSVNRAVDEAVKQVKHIHILVNCAGNTNRKSFIEYKEQDWDEVIDTHVKGTWLVTQAIAKNMISHKQGGSIINISSTLGSRARKNGFSYCAAKAGIEHLTRSLALDLTPYKIRANVIAPGWFITDLNRDFLQTEAGEKFMERVPMLRTGDLSELDGALLLLASDASSYMTGSVINVDGGYAANEV